MMISTVSSFSPSMATARVAPPSKNNDTQRSGMKLGFLLAPNPDPEVHFSTEASKKVESAIQSLNDLLKKEMLSETFQEFTENELNRDAEGSTRILEKLIVSSHAYGLNLKTVRKAEKVLTDYKAQYLVPAKNPIKPTVKKINQALNAGLVQVGFVLPTPKKQAIGPNIITFPVQFDSSPSSPDYKNNTSLIKQLADQLGWVYRFETPLLSEEEIHTTQDPKNYAYRLIPGIHLLESEEYDPYEGFLPPQVPDEIVKAVEKVDSLIRRKDA
ncbi:MAG: hypothetical protein ACK5T0_01740 [Vampirovibrionales bacterium]|jgi:hypothetical protein